MSDKIPCPAHMHYASLEPKFVNTKLIQLASKAVVRCILRCRLRIQQCQQIVCINRYLGVCASANHASHAMLLMVIVW